MEEQLRLFGYIAAMGAALGAISWMLPRFIRGVNATARAVVAVPKIATALGVLVGNGENTGLAHRMVAVEDTLAEVRAELRVNGGASLRDQVDNLTCSVEDVNTKLAMLLDRRPCE